MPQECASHSIFLTNPDGQQTGAGSFVIVANQAPVLSAIEGADLGYTENAGLKSVTGALVLEDQDNSALVGGAGVSISNGFVVGQDTLIFNDPSGKIHGSYNPLTGVLTLINATATPATVAEWQAALRSVKYLNASDDPNTQTRTISFQVDDGEVGSNLSNVVTRDIAITAVNDPPALATLQIETTPATTAGPIPSTAPAANTGQWQATVNQANQTLPALKVRTP